MFYSKCPAQKRILYPRSRIAIWHANPWTYIDHRAMQETGNWNEEIPGKKNLRCLPIFSSDGEKNKKKLCQATNRSEHVQWSNRAPPFGILSSPGKWHDFICSQAKILQLFSWFRLHNGREMPTIFPHTVILLDEQPSSAEPTKVKAQREMWPAPLWRSKNTAGLWR